MSEYEGKENLDIMSLACNYNNDIYSWITKDVIHHDDLVLDFGSRKGEFCNRFKKQIYAVEIDKTMHSYLKCPVKQNIKDFNQKFDLIYSSNVLEHIENDTQSINELYEHLNIGGTIKILVPAQRELYSEMDKAVGHHRRYTKEELVKKFRDAGFQIEYCKYFDSVGYVAALVHKITSNKATISQKSLAFYDRFVFPISKMIDKITLGKIIGKNIVLKAVKQNC